MGYYIRKELLYRSLFIFLLVCSIWLTVSCFLFFRFDAPLNFSHSSIVISGIVLLFIFRDSLSFKKPHFFLIVFFLSILLLSIVKFFFIENVTLRHSHWVWNNMVKSKAYVTFNSYYLFFKEFFHLIFLLITLIVSSIVIKKSNLEFDKFKFTLQKYLYYLVVFYLIIYGVFFIYEDVIYLFGTNRYNGFRSFTAVPGQNFLEIFPYRLGITHTEPSFSGLYVLIFTPLIFLKSKYSKRLKILVPLFFLFNSSKYVLAVTAVAILVWLIIYLYKISRKNGHKILGYISLFLFISLILLYRIYDDKILEILNGYSGYSRLFSIFSGLYFFIQNIFFGTGIGQFPIHFINTFEGSSYLENILIINPSAQSMFVSGLAEFGIIYMVFIAFIIYFLYKSYQRDVFLFYCSLILIFNFNASAGNGFNMIYYWVLLIFFSYYAWETKKT